MNRSEVTKRIKTALKAKTGKAWSVTGGRGTGWGWIDVQAPKSRRVAHTVNPQWNGFDSIPVCISKTGKPPWIEYISNDPALNDYMSDEDRAELGQVFGLNRPAHHQGVQISPDNWERFMDYIGA